ncbi:MAG: hypothetical protein ABSB29_02805 [Nitrososphaerales archaeon]|jgi:hypothetical protein
MQITLRSSSRRSRESLNTKAKTFVVKGRVDVVAVDEMKQHFSLKYGPGEVRKYYPTSEVALEISL